ncbi:MAG: hypothetical protein BGO68_02985 [Candidatus Amoebophilus sp. 36-38]|nr:MAG: hypothetical protein BGO68_02985 [Candidatus Amoebophilus sp. 36-38]
MAKIYIYCGIVLTFILGCGEKPMPSDEAYRIPENTKPAALSKEWEEKFALIDDSDPGKKNLIDNIMKLTKENRDALLEMLNVNPYQEEKKRFLQDFASFSKDQQAHLISILLHLEKEDKTLILKLISPEEFNLTEKLKMLKLYLGLDSNSRNLIEEFEKKLEEDPQ